MKAKFSSGRALRARRAPYGRTAACVEREIRETVLREWAVRPYTLYTTMCLRNGGRDFLVAKSRVAFSQVFTFHALRQFESVSVHVPWCL